MDQTQLKMVQDEGIETIISEYNTNEDINAHCENYVLLAKYFGTNEELRECHRILQRRNQFGHLPAYDSNWLYRNINPYFRVMNNLFEAS